MNIGKVIVLIISHGISIAIGFAGGVYMLPIIIAPAAPTSEAISTLAGSAEYRSEFRRDLKDSDALHWGEGELFVSRDSISFMGKLAPGPDYKLYLSPSFVETEAEFVRQKSNMVLVGSVQTFDNFLIKVPQNIDPANYTTVIVWCESFGEFITAAKYQGDEA